MQVVKAYPNGIFSWVDLMTTDQEGAKAFYSAIFGWDVNDQPTDMGGVYSMFEIEGYGVAGGGEMSPDMKAAGMPTVWTSYVKHDNADTIAEKVTAAGGVVIMPPMDVMQEGRMLMAQDPTGAVFGVWQPKNHIGAQLVNQANTLVWNELQTRDIPTAREFYSAVFGWTYETDASGYVMCKQDGRMHAGMLQIDERWGDAPNNWSVYFLVDDVDAKAEQVTVLGGNIIVPRTNAGDMGSFVVAQDPQGGVFTIMTFTGPVDPPPGY